jgi:phosphotransferase system HPr (HPr) family protein
LSLLRLPRLSRAFSGRCTERLPCHRSNPELLRIDTGDARCVLPQTDSKSIAPLSGVLVPLESVPDPVFAQKMVGDGISLDPTSGDLLAPVAGTVTQLHQAHHALTITTRTRHRGAAAYRHRYRGAQGRRFQAEGDARASGSTIGQLLINFDVDRGRAHGTQPADPDSDRQRRYGELASCRPPGSLVAGQSVVLTLELVPNWAADSTTASPLESTLISAVAGNDAAVEAAARHALTGDEVRLPNLSGLHARPAAVLVSAAKKFKSDVRLLRGADEANAKSVVALLGLGTRCGDVLRVSAVGPDASAAVQKVSALLAEGCGEQAGEALPPTAPLPALATSARALAGVSASPGLAVGRVIQYRHAAIEVAESAETPARERSKLDGALHDARGQIEALKGQFTDPAKVQILEAHQELLEDPDLVDLAIAGVSQGKSAGSAWRAAFSACANRLEALDNALLRERGNDIRDVGRRVLVAPRRRQAGADRRARRVDPDRRGTDAVRHGVSRPQPGARLLHHHGRRDESCGDSRPLVRHAGCVRHRPGRAGACRRHAGGSRWQSRRPPARAD